jgi:glycosyltransferase involved in cell wall biosynthesis
MRVPPVTGPQRGPLVSVVVPCYNGARTIRGALESLMTQDLPSPYEVIVVDSSSDGTDVIVSEEFPGVRLIRRETRTPVGAARNLGVGQAQGNIIAFFDADCVADRGWLRHLASAHQTNVAGVGGSVANGNPGSLVGWASFLMEFSRLAPSSPRGLVPDIVGCNCSYNRWVFETYGPYHDGDYAGDDMLLNRRLILAGERLLFEPRAVVFHWNRGKLGDFVRHMRHLGEGVGMVRLLNGMPHAYLGRHWWLATALLPYRVGRIACRALRWHPRDAWRLPLVMPLVAVGFLAFSWGELGARRSAAQRRAGGACSRIEVARQRSDS